MKWQKGPRRRIKTDILLKRRRIFIFKVFSIFKKKLKLVPKFWLTGLSFSAGEASSTPRPLDFQKIKKKIKEIRQIILIYIDWKKYIPFRGKIIKYVWELRRVRRISFFFDLSFWENKRRQNSETSFLFLIGRRRHVVLALNRERRKKETETVGHRGQKRIKQWNLDECHVKRFRFKL